MKGDVGAGIMKQVEDYTGTHLDIMWTPKDNYDDKLNLVLAGGPRLLPQIQSLRRLSTLQEQALCGMLRS